MKSIAQEMFKTKSGVDFRFGLIGKFQNCPSSKNVPESSYQENGRNQMVPAVSFTQ